MDWRALSRILAEMDPDYHGVLVDVLVDDTTLDHWQRLLDGLRSRPEWTVRYSVDGDEVELPLAAAEPHAVYERAHPSLGVTTGDLTFTGHFFAVAGMEFDVPARDVLDAERSAEFLAFVRWLSDVVGLPVTATTEFDHDRPFLEHEEGMTRLVTRPPTRRLGSETV